MLEGRRHAVYGESREAVIDAIADIRRRLRKGLPVNRAPEARRRTGDHLRHWLEGRRGTLAERSWANNERYIALHLAPALGSVPLAALTADHLRQLYGRLVRPQGTLSAKTVREVHGTIRQALQQAVDDGLLERNVATLIKLPKSEARTRQYVLPPDQLSRFWRVAQNDRLYALWRLAALVPSRSGELRALAWDDLDERNGLLFIRRSVRRTGDGGRELETKAPKTAAGARQIDLDDELLEALRHHRRRQLAERQRAGSAWTEHRLVFCSRWGTPLMSGNILRAFRRLLARAGLSTHFRVHDLRHTAVSSLLIAGIPLAEVAQLAGHAGPQITAALYAHAVRRSRSPATAQLAAFYRSGAEAAGAEPGAEAEAGG